MKLKELEYALQHANEDVIGEDDYFSALEVLSELVLQGLPVELVEGVAPLVRQMIGRFGVLDSLNREQLRAAVKNEEEEKNIREGSLAFLMHLESRLDDGKSAFDEISESQRIDLCGPWVRPMIKRAFAFGERDSFHRTALRTLIRNTSVHNRLKLIIMIEDYSKEYGGKNLDLREVLPDEH
jgi:hypothetical protein